MKITNDLIQEELKKLTDLPTPVAWWEVKVGSDWDGDPTVFVWAVLEDENADSDEVLQLRDIIWELLLEVTRRESDVEWLPHVRFYGASERRANVS